MEKFDLIVIGSGPGGYVAAIKAAQLGLKTACVENRDRLGGTCLNIGCIPSKTLLQDTHLFHQLKHDSAHRGIKARDVQIDVQQLMVHKMEIVNGLTDGIDLLFRKHKVTRIDGKASFKDKNILNIIAKSGETKEVYGEKIMIATGSEPSLLPNVEIDEEDIVSSTGALSFKKAPETLVVIGGGVIGLELGSVWARLGAKVTVVEYLDGLLAGQDDEIRKAVQKSLEKQGMEFKLSKKVMMAEKTTEGVKLILEAAQGGESEIIKAEKILVATGRRPYTEGLALQNIGLEVDKYGFIEVNGAFQTSIAHIYAIGDVIGGAMLAHKAEEEGLVAVNHIKGIKSHINYASIPSVVYIWPEVASVGFTTEEAKKADLDISVGKFPFIANSRARAMDDTEGFVKVIMHRKSGRLIGCHIFGANAGDVIQEAVLVMEKGGKGEDIAYACHSHPSLGEALKEAAMAAIDKPIHT